MSPSFETKQIEPCERVCFRLKELRESKGVTLLQMEERTKLSKKQLEAIESCQFDTLPHGALYRKQFIKKYASALKVDPKRFVSQFESEELSATKHKENIHPKKDVRRSYFHNMPLLSRVGIVALLFAFCLGYLGLQIKHIVEPPRLVLLSPTPGLVSNSAEVTVAGETDREARVTINGAEIPNTEAGTFAQTLSLSPGLNTIVITSEKKHGGKSEETRYVVLEDKKTNG